MNKIHTKKTTKKGEPEAVNQNIHPTTIIESNCIIEDEVSINQYTRIMNNCVIGNATQIGQNVFIEEGVQIGKNCEIQNNSYRIKNFVIFL
jgi:UDP-3-O-[3-hydroxymyristoyl] glucosamine N-acyltransferase